ncbi:MAG: DUF5106 domain-containing protein [Vicingaceae bacterium]
MKRFLITFLIGISLFSIEGYSQEYEIKIKVDGLSDTTAFLAYYYGKGQYYKDTAEVNNKGEMTFAGKDSLAHGMYSLILNDVKYLDFIVDNQKFSLTTDTVNSIEAMKIKGSPENELFYEYLNFLNVRQREAKSLQSELENADESRKEEINERMSMLDKEVRTYIDELHSDHEGSFTSNFIYALEFPQVPEPPKNDDGSIDSNFAFNYFKEHFFDNLDFTDQRLLNSSTYHEKVFYYMNKLTLQDPDSIIKSVDYILGLAAQNPELFKYTLSNLTYKYERSEQMGMDAVFVHLAKNYFMKGMADDWFGEKELKKLSERANSLEPLLIGKKAPNIVVKDTAQEQFIELYKIKAKYTVVYIWSPECGHCKIATPKLKKIYDKYKDKGVEVFGVGNEFENKEWLEFIRKHDLNWINGSDGGDFRSNFRTLYDVYSTPQTYLLDENKVILSKKMSVESLENILEFYFKGEEKANGEEKK